MCDAEVSAYACSVQRSVCVRCVSGLRCSGGWADCGQRRRLRVGPPPRQLDGVLLVDTPSTHSTCTSTHIQRTAAYTLRPRTHSTTRKQTIHAKTLRRSHHQLHHPYQPTTLHPLTTTSPPLTLAGLRSSSHSAAPHCSPTIACCCCALCFARRPPSAPAPPLLPSARMLARRSRTLPQRVEARMLH